MRLTIILMTFTALGLAACGDPAAPPAPSQMFIACTELADAKLLVDLVKKEDMDAVSTFQMEKIVYGKACRFIEPETKTTVEKTASTPLGVATCRRPQGDTVCLWEMDAAL